MNSPAVNSCASRRQCRRDATIAGIWLLLFLPPCLAADGDADGALDAGGDHDTAQLEVDLLDDARLVGVEDIDLIGNPARSLFKRWPEDLVIAPVPGRSPQLGWTVAVGAAFFLDSKDASDTKPPSVIGVFGMTAENGSVAYGVGSKLYLMDDNLRITLGGGYLDVRYEFFGIGNDAPDLGFDIDILQQGPVFAGSASWRLWKKLYAGLGFVGADIETRVRLGVSLPGDFPDPTLDLGVRGLTVPVEIDSRDDEQFPRSGWLARLNTVLYRKSLGGDFDTETSKLEVNHYWPVRGDDVLATRFVIRATGDGAPFFVLSSFGGGTDLRGYPAGRYRDRMMYAMQSEYRWQVSNRWIVTGFVGVGEVAERFSDLGQNFLPAAGAGLRYVLSDKHRVSLSFDVASGDDGSEYYFGVNEAF